MGRPANIDGAIAFRPLATKDLPRMHAWFAQPHMEHWTRGHTYSLAEIENRYLPVCAGEDIAHGFVAEIDDRQAGYFQWYPVAASWPEGITSAQNRLFGPFQPRDAAGIDLLLGEPDLVGGGLGPRVIAAFLAEHVFPRFRVVLTDPLAVNVRAIRAFEKAGFRRTDASEDPNFVVLVVEAA